MTEAVDRLLGVAHQEEPAPLGRGGLYEALLKGVGVLVLVDEDLPERERASDGRDLAREADHVVVGEKPPPDPVLPPGLPHHGRDAQQQRTQPVVAIGRRPGQEAQAGPEGGVITPVLGQRAAQQLLYHGPGPAFRSTAQVAQQVGEQGVGEGERVARVLVRQGQRLGGPGAAQRVHPLVEGALSLERGREPGEDPGPLVRDLDAGGQADLHEPALDILVPVGVLRAVEQRPGRLASALEHVGEGQGERDELAGAVLVDRVGEAYPGLSVQEEVLPPVRREGAVEPVEVQRVEGLLGAELEQFGLWGGDGARAQA